MRSLRYISRINKQLLPANAEDTLRNAAEQTKGAVYGPASFISSSRLARNTALLVVCWYGQISAAPTALHVYLGVAPFFGLPTRMSEQYLQ
jgi:hypothetical protein